MLVSVRTSPWCPQPRRRSALAFDAAGPANYGNGSEVLQRLLQVRFEGVTGNVSFASTGDRHSASVAYELVNFGYDANALQVVSLTAVMTYVGGALLQVAPITWIGGSTTLPLDKLYADIVASRAADDRRRRLIIYVAIGVSAGMFAFWLASCCFLSKVDRLARRYGVQRRVLLAGWFKMMRGVYKRVKRLPRAIRRCCRSGEDVETVEGDARSRWVTSVLEAAGLSTLERYSLAHISDSKLRRILIAVNTAPKRQTSLDMHLEALNANVHGIKASDVPALLTLLTCDLPFFRDLFAKYTADASGASQAVNNKSAPQQVCCLPHRARAARV